MRLPRIAAIALLGTAAMGVSAANAFADDDSHHRFGQIEAAPHVVKAGHKVMLSTESCDEGPAKASVKIDGVRHTVWLNHLTSEGWTGWLHVPRDTDPGKYRVWGHCDDGPVLKGAFWVKHVHHMHHHHHHCGCRHWDWDRH